jgi:hypothetical protein
LEGIADPDCLHPISEDWFAIKHGAGHPQQVGAKAQPNKLESNQAAAENNKQWLAAM